jgi:adenylate kinase
MKYQTYILFGAPGSGKGTQGRTLGSIPRFFHCACGDVFRSIDTRTKVGRAFLDYSSKGQLVPDEITVELWKAQIDAAVLSSPISIFSSSTAFREMLARPESWMS